MTSDGGRRRLAWIAWVTICLVWGTSFAAVKIALETVPPFFVGGIRFLFGGLILGAIVIARSDALPDPKRIYQLAITGSLLFLVGNGGVIWGVTTVPTGLTAVLVGTSPFWMTGLDAALRGGRQLFLQQWLGLAVGFAGIVYLVWPDLSVGGATARSFAFGVLAVQIGCVGWSLGSLYTRYRVPAGSLMGSAAVQMIFGGLFMLVVGMLRGETGQFSLTLGTSLAMLYLTIVGSVVGFAAFSYAMQHLDVAIVSLYTYINPVVAVAVGTWLLDEPFDVRMIVAAAVIVVGIVIVGPTGRTSDADAARPLPE